MNIKYPDGRKTNYQLNQNKKDNSKSHLGLAFEEKINAANKYYLENEIAVIYKKPTPIQVVNVSYPSRNKAKITEAYYKTPSTTDYNGIYKQNYIDFEAKSCKELNFAFERIYEHQIRHLELIDKLGGISFLIIEFSNVNETYILPSKNLILKYNESLNGGRKSIPYSYFKEYGYKVKEDIILDYLDVIDTFFIKKNNSV